MTTRLIVAGETILRFSPHVKFRHDETRGRWVILAPERLLLPDEVSIEILKLMDGKQSVDGIVDMLVDLFGAPREVIAADVLVLLQDLADKGVVTA